MKNFFLLCVLLGFGGAFALCAYAMNVDFPPLAFVGAIYAIFGSCAVVGYGREVRKDYDHACERSLSRAVRF